MFSDLNVASNLNVADGLRVKSNVQSDELPVININNPFMDYSEDDARMANHRVITSRLNQLIVNDASRGSLGVVADGEVTRECLENEGLNCDKDMLDLNGMPGSNVSRVEIAHVSHTRVSKDRPHHRRKPYGGGRRHYERHDHNRLNGNFNRLGDNAHRGRNQLGNDPYRGGDRRESNAFRGDRGMRGYKPSCWQSQLQTGCWQSWL